MAKYRITDPTSGRTITVEGEAPPSPEDIQSLFSQLPSTPTTVPPAPVVPPEAPSPSATALANEFVAGAARPLAELVDIAQSPYQVFRMAVLGKEPQSVRSIVGGQPGAYAGQGIASQIAGTAGELASYGINFTAATRGLTTRLLDDASRYGESALRGVLRQFGKTTPAQDLLSATTAATGMVTGGAMGEALGGQQGQQVGQAIGGAVFPIAAVGAVRPLASLADAAPVLNRFNNTITSFINRSAPDSQEIKGAGRLLYKQIEDLGIVFNEQATSRLVNQLKQVAASEDLSGLRRDSPVSGQYRTVLDILERGGDFTGTEYSMLDKASSTFRDIASTKRGEDAGRIAARLAEQVDNFLMSVEPGDLAYYKNGQVSSVSGPGIAEVGKTLVNARGLWRRANAAQAIETAVEEARIASLGIGRTGADYDAELANSLRKMLKEQSSRFSEGEKQQIETALKGGRVRKILEVLSKFGIQSNDYVMASLLGIGAGMAARDSISEAAAVGAAAVGGTKLLSMATQAAVSNLFRNDVKLMQASIAAGPNAQAQVRAYLNNTPVGQRDPKKLAAIFVSSGADLSGISEMPARFSPFLSDSVAFATALRTAIEEENTQPTE